MGSIPIIEFHVNEAMNRFCHVSVLYSELFPIELSNGMLGNRAHQLQNSQYLDQRSAHTFARAKDLPASEWYSFARTIMRNQPTVTENVEVIGPRVLMDILRSTGSGFEEMWNEVRQKLEIYKDRFVTSWAPISNQVLEKLSTLAKNEWTQNDIQVHFVDCLYGGFAWYDSIALATLPDTDVEKKFLAHELSELITPRSLMEARLREHGLDREIAHTIVDLIAYFSVRDHIENYSEKKGVKTNPSYYPGVNQLEPLFEEYSNTSALHDSFETLAQDIVSRLTTKI